MSIHRLLLILCSGLLVMSCKKDAEVKPKPEPTPPAPVTSTPTSTPTSTVPHTLTFNFKALANNKPLVGKTAWYTNASQEGFNVTKFNYYLSNFKFRRDDGFTYAEPESYHLIQHLEGKTSFSLAGIPEGNYTSIEFYIGVDSLRNISGAQGGDLDPANLMFWDWEQGYIFFKLEGDYTSVKVPTDGQYGIHIGGFAGPYTCLQKCSFSLAKPITVKKGVKSVISYNVLVDEIFQNPQTIGFDDYFAAVNERMFKSISINYSDMFVIEKIEN